MTLLGKILSLVTSVVSTSSKPIPGNEGDIRTVVAELPRIEELPRADSKPAEFDVKFVSDPVAAIVVSKPETAVESSACGDETGQVDEEAAVLAHPRGGHFDHSRSEKSKARSIERRVARGRKDARRRAALEA